VEWTKYFLYHLQTSLSKSSLQFHIFFFFFCFFVFLKGRWGREGQAGGVFPKPVNATFSSQAQSSCCSCKKKDKHTLFMSAMSSWKCHSFVTIAQSMPDVFSSKRSLNSNKRKILTSGRGHRQGAGVEEAKFRWQVIAVAVCLAVCLIIVLPVLALINPVKERQDLKQQFCY